MTFEGRILVQASRANFIEALHTEATSNRVKELSIGELQSKLDVLETYWANFEEQHLKLLTGKDTTILEHDYVKKKVYDTCLQEYSTTRSILIGLIKTLDVSVDLSETFHHRSTNVPAIQVTQRQLPEIPLRIFSGLLSEWTAFKELFLSMIIANNSLSTIEKLHYLLTSLVGEPRELLAGLPVIEDSFLPAWEMLCARYDNERLLISTQLEKLLNAPSVADNSSKELNGLLNSTSEALNALKSLGRPVATWDDVLVHVVSSRLDPKTLEAWENKIGATTAFPTFTELKDFIIGRARARERIEMHSLTQQSTKVKPVRALTVSTEEENKLEQVPGAQSWAAMSADPCSMCSEDHFIDKCQKFKQLTPEKRKEFVEKKYLCFNCLGKHSIRYCRITTTCVVCHKPHHSMIHISRPKGGRSVQAPEIPSGESSIQSTTQPPGAFQQ